MFQSTEAFKTVKLVKIKIVLKIPLKKTKTTDKPTQNPHHPPKKPQPNPLKNPHQNNPPPKTKPIIPHIKTTLHNNPLRKLPKKSLIFPQPSQNPKKIRYK